MVLWCYVGMVLPHNIVVSFRSSKGYSVVVNTGVWDKLARAYCLLSGGHSLIARCSGALVQWCSGAVVLWCSGAMVHWKR